MSTVTIPLPRPPMARPAPPTARGPSVPLLDVQARPVDLEPGLWVWAAFDGDRTHVASGTGDGSQIAEWIRDRWDGPLVLRGANTDRICADVPGAAPDPTVVPPHGMDALMRAEEARTVSGLPRLQVATDGASANGFVGSGWVASDGRHGAHGGPRRGSRQVNAARAEFAAVAAAVQALHPDRRVELLIDATVVAQDVRRAVAGEPVRFGSKMPGRTVDALAGRDVKVTWVQGHSGHLMNEAADRLAVHARRCAQAGTEPSPQVLAQIVSEAGLAPVHLPAASSTSSTTSA